MSVFAFAGPRHGRAAVLEAMAAIAQALRSRVTRRKSVVDGARTALMSDVSYMQRATDRVLRLRIANFLSWQDGRLIESREFIDSFDAVEQALGRESQLHGELAARKAAQSAAKQNGRRDATVCRRSLK